MNDFQLQTRIDNLTRREVFSYAKKRKLELKIENQNTELRKRFEKTFASWGAFILIYALVSFAFNFTFDNFIFFIMGISVLIDSGLLLENQRQKKKSLKLWNDTPPRLDED